MKSNVIIFSQPLKVDFSHIDVPDPGPGQVVTKTILTGVSTGTETRVWTGKEDPNAFPLIPGYENVGEIVRVGADVPLKPGTLVFHSGSDFTGEFSRLWGAHAEFCLINMENAIPIPDGMAPQEAIYTLVGAIALHGIHRGTVTAADNVAVVGLGLIGHLAAQCAAAQGAHVIALDYDQSRLDAVAAAGVDVCLNATGIDIKERVAALSNGGVDIVVDATGLASAADSIARLIRPMPWTPPYPANARVVLLGSYAEPISFNYHPTLFSNEPDILPSRYCTKAEMFEVLDMIKDGRLKPDAIPSLTYPVENAPSAYEALIEKKLMRIMFEW